jgi:hypothetical protein
MDPEPGADAPTRGASWHALGNLELSEAVEDTGMVNTKDGEVL